MASTCDENILLNKNVIPTIFWAKEPSLPENVSANSVTSSVACVSKKQVVYSKPEENPRKIEDDVRRQDYTFDRRIQHKNTTQAEGFGAHYTSDHR